MAVLLARAPAQRRVQNYRAAVAQRHARSWEDTGERQQTRGRDGNDEEEGEEDLGEEGDDDCEEDEVKEGGGRTPNLFLQAPVGGAPKHHIPHAGPADPTRN